MTDAAAQPLPDARRTIATYLVCVFALSSIFYTLIIRDGHLAAGHGLYVFLLMWCPGVSALITSLVVRRPFRAHGWSWKWRYQWASYALPIAYATVAYAAVWALGFGGVPDWAKPDAFMRSIHFSGPRPVGMALWIGATITLGASLSVISALGEEIGWRGLLVPELARTTTFTRTALISGAIWATWHVPILLFADYNNGTPAWYGLSCFAVMVIGINFAFVYLRLRSGSLWTGAVMHATHNTVIQAILTPLTIDTGRTKWFVDEFGCALAIVAVLLAFLIWRRQATVAERSNVQAVAPSALPSNSDVSTSLFHGRLP
jgi:membrane protease YdiL (CAAX protease family)